jgi:plastocyanin
MGHLYTLKRRIWVVAAAFLLVLGVVALIPLVAGPRGQTREIVLVARQMAYYVEGQTTPNPTLRVAPRERVRLVLRNEDPGMTHDLTLGSLKVSVPAIAAQGRSSVEFRAPAEPGRHRYVCTPHAKMMFGTLEVTPGDR